ncbi:MAG: DUF4397 domain-containing protein, partial [Rubrivivax sp.]|nr:DUF4397 domain-containing protein [Rubrivivax sp.]
MNAHPPPRPLRTLRQPTRRPFLRHLLGASGLLAGSLLLAGCGGGSDSSGGGQAQVRALNLATDLPSVDLDAGDVQFFGAVAVDELRAYKALDTGTYTLKVKRAGDGTTLLSGSYALSKDLSYTAVIWGRETALRLSTLPENETNSDIPSGSARVRIFNATVDTGSVDIFLTASTTDIGEAQATQASVNSGGISGYREISKGTYRLRVTGAGDPSDLRLDVAELTLGDQQHSSLILSPGASGMLVHATHLVQQGAQTVMKNTKARVRVVASVDAAGNVAATLGGRTLAGGLRSPSVGPYQLVDATSAELTLRVNGNVVLNEARSFTAGTDYTLLAHGSAAAS